MGSTSRKDITTLLWFRLSEIMNNEPLTIDIDSLLCEGMEEYVHKVMGVIGAPNEKIAASMIIKRYAFFACLALSTMSQSDRRLNVQTNNVIFVSHHEDRQWLPKFYLKDLTFESLSGSRERWREQYVKDIFANHINLLIDQLSIITKIAKLILWENVAVYLFWLYETVLDGDEDRKRLVGEDFRYLFHDAPGSIFGSYNHNPLTKYESEKIFILTDARDIRSRKTCCFSYQLKGSNQRCITCPCMQTDKEGRCQSEQSFCSTIRSVNE